MFKNLKRTIAEAAAQAAMPIAQRLQKGLNVEQVDDKTYELRLAICDGCAELTDTGHCGICYCPVTYKAKLKFNPYAAGVGIKKEVKCPAGKW